MRQDSDTHVNPQTTFHMTIQRNNTGYFCYTNAVNGDSATNNHYHGDNRDELTRLDENNIYVGFYASRSVKVSFKAQASLTTVVPENDAPAEAKTDYLCNL